LGAHVRQYVPLAIVAIALLGFGMLADEVVEGDTLAFDRAVLLWFRVPGNIAVPIGPLWVQEAVRDVTSLGSFVVLTIVTIVTVVQLLLSGKRGIAVYIGLAVASGTVISTVLKMLFDRPRPDIPGVPHVFTSSFPSGHATVSGVVFLTIAAVLTAATRSKQLKIFYLGVGLFLTLIVGISRIYEGVHYPTDQIPGPVPGAFDFAVFERPFGALDQKARKPATHEKSVTFETGGDARCGIAADVNHPFERLRLHRVEIEPCIERRRQLAGRYPVEAPHVT